MKIGITGSKGFIGSHLARQIKDPIIFGTYLENLEAARAFVQECDRIYHVAGKNRAKEGEILKNNLLGTANLVLAMYLEKKYPELIFVSSTQVEWSSATNEYALSKYLEERAVKEAGRWCIYRVPNVYGSGARPFYNSVVATFCHQVAWGEKLTINDPSAGREFIYIDDLIGSLLDPKFDEYKRLRGEPLTIGQVAHYLTDGLGKHKNLEKTLEYYIKEAKNVSST